MPPDGAAVAVVAEPEVLRAWARGFRPDPELLLSEWADEHRRLPQKSSAEPGPWRTKRTPYLREIMDCLSATSTVEEVILMKAAQVGGSEVILNQLGYIIDHSPGPTLLVQPTVELAKRFSRQRVEPLVEDTPRLAGKVAEARTRDARSSMLAKEFLGGVLVITGANSAVGLRSMPAKYLLLDEIDGYPLDVDDEGAPIDLAEARQRTFARRKRIKVSTPTIAGASPIEHAYEATDRRRYYVPCPGCGAYQVLEFERLTWTRLGLSPEDAVYLCRHCEQPIEESRKTEMLEAGEWRPENPERADPSVRGYHISALYAPLGWLSWGKIAKQYAKVHKVPEQHRVFRNTVLGETWQEKGEAPEWERLYARREAYALGTVPRGGLFLTAGVDVQKDRLIVEIVAWGRGKTSWSVDYIVLPGDTAEPESGAWPQLDAVLGRRFRHELGVPLEIAMLAVDSGYNTQTVYSWARRYPLNRVLAVKGQEYGGMLIGSPTTVDINLRGRRPVHGYKVWPVVGSLAKRELYGFLRLEAADDGRPAGWCHFPEYDEEYFRQLTAEHLVTRRGRGGFARLTWELIPGMENHALDCRVYARAAAALYGLDRFGEREWLALEAAVGQHPPAPTPAGSPKPDARAPRKPWLEPRGRGWLR